jgi:hypothetical protein
MGRAGEVDPAHGRVGDQPRDNRGGILRGIADDVDHAVAQAGILQDLADQAVHRRAQFRGLEHHGIAAGQRHGDGTRGKDDRGIPRRDPQHHAARLTQAMAKLPGTSDGITSPVIWVVIDAASRSMLAARRTLKPYQLAMAPVSPAAAMNSRCAPAIARRR